MELRAGLGHRHLLAALLGIAAVIAIVTAPGLLGDEVGLALDELDGASAAWLWLAAASFGAALVALGCAWRAALRRLGGELDRLDATARYGAGSLANVVLPGGLGSAFRIALYSRTLSTPHRLWTAGGVGGAIDVARALGLAVLVLVAAAIGSFPLWPVGVLLGVVAAAVPLALVAGRRAPRGRLAHLLDAFRELGRSPRAAAELLGWTTVATALRVSAAAAVIAAFGIARPLEAALVVVPALALAGLVQLTPGNVGVVSGAVAVALHAQGVDLATALSVGIAFHAVETAAGVALGCAGLLYLARPLPAWTLGLAGTGACLALAAAVGATILA